MQAELDELEKLAKRIKLSSEYLLGTITANCKRWDGLTVKGTVGRELAKRRRKIQTCLLKMEKILGSKW
jgi:hypothetical protein